MLKDKDKEILINTINKKGFLLEEKVWKILSNLGEYCEKHHIIQSSDDRIEIDCLIKLENKIFVIECKHTDYSWIFTKAPETPNMVNLVFYNPDMGIIVRSRETKDFNSAHSSLSIRLKEDLSIVQEKNTPDLAQTSYKDVNDAVIQVLKQSRSFISEGHLNIKGKFIIPLIVTNNPNFYLDYRAENLKDNGDLKDFIELRKQKGIVFNYPEKFGFENRDKALSIFGDGKIKSIFITDVNNLLDFINKIKEQNLAGIKSGEIHKI